MSKREVTDAIKEMERKFEVLSGQALKEPLIEIYYQNNPISGKTTTIDIEIRDTSHVGRFPGLFVKNIGDKKAEDVSFHFYFSEKIRLLGEEYEGRLPGALYTTKDEKLSGLENYPYTLELEGKISLNPLEHWSFPVNIIFFYPGKAPTKVGVKLLIFYGAEKPTETNFIFIKK